ncbi:MAG: glycosyltransferase family 2 protein [Chlamydiia bacterium]|nr:glycosyltransferase family 2 protein [Chlamydiia bacterium]
MIVSMMRSIVTFFIFFAQVLSASSISVIVPSHWKHARFLEELLDAYAAQSRLPDEVVISLSEAGRVDPALLAHLEQKVFPFEVRILKTDGVLYAGQNRNCAAKAARYEILVAQDADDLPHPQRLEIIAHVMENPKVSHLIHQWYPGEEGHTTGNPPPEWVEFYDDFGSIPLVQIKSLKDFTRTEYLCNGHIALRKALWEEIKWPDNPRGQDLLYNVLLLSHFKNTHLLLAPLTLYRHQYSSLDGRAL